MVWLNDIDALLDSCLQYQTLLSTITVRNIILKALKGDGRYNDVVAAIHHHPLWPMSAIREHLQATARVIGDLKGTGKPSGACRNWAHTGVCTFGHHCRFTHGRDQQGRSRGVAPAIKAPGTARRGTM